MDFKKILVPTEFDEISAKATHFAVQLAEQLNIHEVVLLDVVMHPKRYDSPEPKNGGINTDATSNYTSPTMENERTKLATEIAKRYSTSSVRVNPNIRFNSGTAHLNEYIEEFNADLVVAGNRDEGTLMEKILGSETHKMIRHTMCPLIILNQSSTIPEISEITLAIDVKEEEHPGVDAIISFARQIGARLQLLHVICEQDKTEPEEAIQHLNHFASSWDLHNHGIHVVNSDNLEDGLWKFIRKYSPDMLAVLTQGKGRLNTLLFGSATETMISETDKPVLVNKIT